MTVVLEPRLKPDRQIRAESCVANDSFTLSVWLQPGIGKIKLPALSTHFLARQEGHTLLHTLGRYSGSTGGTCLPGRLNFKAAEELIEYVRAWYH